MFAFFPGILDSDGRPWQQERLLPRFEKGLESALKMAALTHRSLIVPLGYFLDNPALQRIFARYKGRNAESQAFRAVMQDLLRVALNPGKSSPGSIDLATVDAWREARARWIGGGVTGRQQNVYANSVAHETAVKLLRAPNAERFARQLDRALLTEHDIDMQTVFGVLSAAKLPVLQHGSFPFAQELHRFLSGAEHFDAIAPPRATRLREKLIVIDAAARDNGRRISRSLIQSEEHCRELGVPRELTVTPGEYRSIAGMLQHYHHVAFAKALGLAASLSPQAPRPDPATVDLLRKEQAKLLGDSARHHPITERHKSPLDCITFADLYAVRCGKRQHEFLESLDSLSVAGRAGSVAEWREMMERHARFVTGIISLNFSAPSVPDDLSDAVASGITPDAKVVARVVRYACALTRDLLPHVRKELALRWFFRQVTG